MPPAHSTPEPARQTGPVPYVPTRSNGAHSSSEERFVGFIKWFDPERNFGFIASPYTEDIFVHTDGLGGKMVDTLLDHNESSGVRTYAKAPTTDTTTTAWVSFAVGSNPYLACGHPDGPVAIAVLPATLAEQAQATAHAAAKHALKKAEDAKRRVAVPCKFESDCTNQKCPYSHGMFLCKFGETCRNNKPEHGRVCKFLHPKKAAPAEMGGAAKMVLAQKAADDLAAKKAADDAAAKLARHDAAAKMLLAFRKKAADDAAAKMLLAQKAADDLAAKKAADDAAAKLARHAAVAKMLLAKKAADDLAAKKAAEKAAADKAAAATAKAATKKLAKAESERIAAEAKKNEMAANAKAAASKRAVAKEEAARIKEKRYRAAATAEAIQQPGRPAVDTPFLDRDLQFCFERLGADMEADTPVDHCADRAAANPAAELGGMAAACGPHVPEPTRGPVHKALKGKVNRLNLLAVQARLGSGRKQGEPAAAAAVRAARGMRDLGGELDALEREAEECLDRAKMQDAEAAVNLAQARCAMAAAPCQDDALRMKLKLAEAAAVVGLANAAVELQAVEKEFNAAKDAIAEVRLYLEGNQAGIELMMDPAWDKTYGPGANNWTGDVNDAYDRGGEPYYCPKGWKRFGVRVPDFETRFPGTAIVYHGTQSNNTLGMLKSGFRGTRGCYDGGVEVSYYSPSIIYASHGRYAKVWKRKSDGKYIQMVFQCRVKPSAVSTKGKETLSATQRVDPNYPADNSGLEWLVPATVVGDDGRKYVDPENVVIYGIMVRALDTHPKYLPEMAWQQTYWGF